MSYLHTITDEDVFSDPLFEKPDVFEERITVKAIVVNSEGKIALVTNDVHGIYLLPGGGAETVDLENEIKRECSEEIGHVVELIGIVGQTHEFRNREAKEYKTTCFIAETKNKLNEDMRTHNERDNNLQVEWVDRNIVIQIFTKQKEAVRRGDVKFYNTAFNILRDGLFFETYLSSEKSV
jgi:ADP-ribose pyrophosphatase YjhB (NUDIX family)